MEIIFAESFLLALPLLIYPFMTLLFWGVGAGKGIQAGQTKPPQGFNMELPAPVLKNDSDWNKLSSYKQAEEDSARRRKQMKTDPYYNLPLTSIDTSNSVIRELNGKYLPASKSPYSYSHEANEQEAKVYQKLAALDQELSGNSLINSNTHNSIRPSRQVADRSVADDVQKLDNMMKAMQEPREPDPELLQLKKMMETLKEIQHPELVKDKIKEQSNKERGRVFPVIAAHKEIPISLLRDEHQVDTLRGFTVPNGFFGLEDITAQNEPKATAVPAVLATTQLLTNGSTVKLQLSEAIFINGMELSPGQYVYGIAQVSGERLIINISSVRIQNNILPISLSVYDLDGLEGIYIPGSIGRDVTKQSADQPLQSLNMLSLDPSMGLQAASGGIEMAKKIISRKVKQIKATVRSGYQVLLRDKQLGLKEEFTRELVDKLHLQPLTHKHSFNRTVDGNEIKSTLHLNKSDRSNLYFINRHDMQVTKEGSTQPIAHSFPIHQDNKYTFKESYNMMMGRTVYTSHKNKLGEEYNCWSKINWSNKLPNGNHEIKQYNDNYGFKLDNVLAKYPIKELANEQYKNALISSLHRGNLQSATFIGKDGQEEKMFIALGILNVYDASKQKLTTGQLVEKQFIGQELADQLKQRLERLSEKQEPLKETPYRGKRSGDELPLSFPLLFPWRSSNVSDCSTASLKFLFVDGRL